MRSQNPNKDDIAFAREYEVLKMQIMIDVKNDLPLHVGMTIDQLQSFIENNKKNISETAKKENYPVPPIYADPERHLYVFFEPTKSQTLDYLYLKYFVNGRHQFWFDITLQNNIIKNIYITPGNLNIIFPSFLFDGTGNCESCFKLN